ncbi:hypothetical protein PHYSODRAFT_264367 [Phytophthora sojae]|uniref:Uncharacterized protein n=1 Tax=Phytophthora sojae (strain P6497) TaxID=1094619 RepID=G4ZFZ3_PHYSP|nr:hypothetical protein PHYSODRAFT_264367 [Phytophthora sojae]EGZ17060.1 hypothetical protein PHYSODRAFT_264367 [Phytophthora sojae]|eukprot:XP_009526118.1 hypothetical protein PHYSODRAFT_264367 [Phytophthora sojae]
MLISNRGTTLAGSDSIRTRHRTVIRDGKLETQRYEKRVPRERLHDEREEGCSKAAFIAAASNGHTLVLEFLQAIYAALGSGAAELLARHGHLDAVTFLTRHFLVRRPDLEPALVAAAANGHGGYRIPMGLSMRRRKLATVVVKLAMDTASALTARLQLRYPSLRSAKDMFNIVRNASLKTFRKKIVDLHTKIMKELDRSFDTSKPGVYLPNYIPVIFQDGAFGEAYGEDRTPTYVLLPETNNNKVFLLQQMPLLYNFIAEKRMVTGSGYENPAPMDTFVALMDKFFTTREVTVPVVFACIAG